MIEKDDRVAGVERQELDTGHQRIEIALGLGRSAQSSLLSGTYSSLSSFATAS